MILVDANLLIYAHVSDAPLHRPARQWLDDRLNGSARVGLPWPSLLSFLRIVTNPRIFPRPEGIDCAWGQVKDWLGAGPAWIPQPTDRHVAVLEKLIADTGVHANLVPDAHLAALAIEHGLVLCSTDRDFSRFGDLRFENPLSTGRG